ncbi:MAG: hypothetical protein LBB21_06850 [Holosporaceae bacterium]|nr:hypothetical protein [Holosporaceae bacterium]
MINLKIGEICTLTSANDEAMLYLKRSLDSLPSSDLVNLAMNYSLIGIIHMRKDHFNEANNYFEKTIAELDKEKVDNISLQKMKSNIYADMAFNYFMDGINRNNAPKAAEIMEKSSSDNCANHGDKSNCKRKSRRKVGYSHEQISRNLQCVRKI